ncbi:MAG TPA: CD225/dispanin family protein [Micromonosporaceae bacterium]|jgi:hypothetical protein|nr:CD225/dispanin family protein [Micromonosporaceae bacterium]
MLEMVSLIVSILGGVAGLIATLAGLRRKPNAAMAGGPNVPGVVPGAAFGAPQHRTPATAVNEPPSAPQGSGFQPAVVQPQPSTYQQGPPPSYQPQPQYPYQPQPQPQPQYAFQPQPQRQPPQVPRSNVVVAWWSIFVVYFGLPAVIYAYRSRDAYRHGDYVTGDRAFKVSRRWSTASYIALGAYLIYYIALAASGHTPS